MNGYQQEILDYIMLTASNINDEFDNLNKKYSMIYNMLDNSYQKLLKITETDDEGDESGASYDEDYLEPDRTYMHDETNASKTILKSYDITQSAQPNLDAALKKYFPKSLDTNFSNDKNRVSFHNSNKIVPQSSIKIMKVNENTSQESLGTYTKIDNDIMKMAKYTPHNCSPKCLSYFSLDPKNFQSDISVLYIPIQTGWNRMIRNNTKVIYVTPCGLTITSYPELLSYLSITSCRLPVDYFSFGQHLDITRNFEAVANVIDEDITNRSEPVAIPCVNSFDFSYPPDFVYSSTPVPTDDVKISRDSGFLSCCSCTDLCLDSDSCECQRLTADSARRIGVALFNNLTGKSRTEIGLAKTGGYVYRRLLEPLGTGIYECNSNCSCNKRACLNRVVQNGIRYKLQLFKTRQKGWGIRCLNDIPLGAFVCTYTGRILTDRKAELNGYQEGDEYLAQLDFIECAEYLKQEFSGEDYNDNTGNGCDLVDSVVNWDKNHGKTNTGFTGRSSLSLLKQRNKEADNYSFQVYDRPPTFNPSSQYPNLDSNLSSNSVKSTRSLFDGERKCYVMDAKREGNVGRYLNHSCDPNLFVQNVFVSGQDVRFPAIALFANRTIVAGTELTWNYGYEVGSVKGKEIVCRCCSHRCNGRLI
ncbi:unnamed protein product [Gordionus sp. m RMFG-2023]|uniref:histone-lysine N-methyltransferase SETDB1-like n=1 Tax=Gordionus sp. m RMFG-2023 TaxID=3053472 RepID=UPI0030E32195